MHKTAFEYGDLFFKTYVNSEKPIKIIDLGSMDVNGSLRTVAPKKAKYIGVDCADGKGVDIKVNDPYQLPFEDNFFDVAVSSSCFEHVEFFWLSFLELLRVLKPEGLLYINAPSNGKFHRYPVDCWRFYPDSGIALQNWAHRNGLKEAALLESFVGTKIDQWNDFVAVFIKSKKHTSDYKKRMISSLSFQYSNAHLIGSEEVLNFEYQSSDQLLINKQKEEIHYLSTLIQRMKENETERMKEKETEQKSIEILKKKLEDIHKDYLNSRSYRITSPLRRINKFILKNINMLKFIFSRNKYNQIYNFKKNLIEASINTNSKVVKYNDKAFSIADNNSGELNFNFIPRATFNYNFLNNPLKVIAFYLPQFHPIPENDKFWGKGFTEWTNVRKSTPQFTGHYQPHLPGDLGFYDLRSAEVQSLQIEIAKQYGIYGFCYHYFWFNGKRLLQKPLEQFLSNKNLDFPFCLCWANENWTRTWDGMENDILIKQNHSPEDDINFISDIAPALRDNRYIRFNQKPIIIVYKTSLFPDPKATAQRWREYCLKNGVGEIYLIATRVNGFQDPVSIGFDATVEFPPHEQNSREHTGKVNLLNPQFQGHIYDFNDLADTYLKIFSDKYPNLKTVTPGWDNSARRPGNGAVFLGSGTVPYSRWLRGACEQTINSAKNTNNFPPFIFINAWNEWGEGAYLEPDRKYGYANLNVTANILQSYTPIYAEIQKEIENSQINFKKKSNGAVVLHFFYGDLLEEFLPYLERVKKLDLFVSLGPNITLEQIDRLKKNFPNLYLVAYQNKGRDMLPFINLLKILEKFKYQYGCKIHTKKSPYRSDGDKLRKNFLEFLLGSENELKKFMEIFTGNTNTGIIAFAKMFLNLNEYIGSNKFWLDKLLYKMGKRIFIDRYNWEFVAGSMFWFRIDSLSFLQSLDLSDNDFEEELGQLDGTLAHALERIIPLGITQSGLSVLKI